MIFNCFEYLERTSKDPRIPKNSENFRSRGKSLLDFGICLLSFWDFWDPFEIFKKTKFREEGGRYSLFKLDGYGRKKTE